MLKNLFLIIFLLFNFSYGNEKKEKLQLVAKNIEAKDNTIIASNSVIAYSPSYYISADKLIYDRDKESLELFGNVLIIKDNNIQTQSNYAYLDMKNDTALQEPIFLLDESTNIWVNAKELTKEKEKLELVDSIISSCDCFDPAWSIKATSSNYDTKEMWINTFNTRLYIKDVPVFYLPYFGFPTDTTRRTGLLFPTIGYASKEGVLYSQPIFIAPASNYDFELSPQVRTQRGYGVYGTYRYANTLNSMLRIKMGYFKESDSYVKNRELQSNQHYGANLDYEQKYILTDENSVYQDGTYASLNYLNDIEHIELEKISGSVSTDRNVESKLNYYFNTPNYYAGTYLKYYIDTQANNNDATMQELPQVQLHSYNKALFTNNLIYSADLKYQNFTRQKGLESQVYNLNIPIGYTRNILNDYMYIGVDNKTLFTSYRYNNSNINYEDGTLIQNLTTFKVGTDLIKPYKNYIHSMNLSFNYEIPDNLHKDGDLYNVTVKEENDLAKFEELKTFPTIQNKKRAILRLNQSIYAKNSHKQIINHQLSQSIYYDKSDNAKLQDLENYLRINFKNTTFSGKVVYNAEDKKIVETSLDGTFDFENFSVTSGYYSSVKTNNEFFSRDDLESFRLDAKYNFNKYYSMRYYENYDLQEKIRNRQGVGFSINESCWSLDLRYEREIIPTSSSSYRSREQDIVYATLVLKPIGGISQNYKVYDSEQR